MCLNLIYTTSCSPPVVLQSIFYPSVNEALSVSTFADHPRTPFGSHSLMSFLHTSPPPHLSPKTVGEESNVS